MGRSALNSEELGLVRLWSQQPEFLIKSVLCALMLLATGGSYRAMAFGGMGICVAEKREHCDVAWARELGGGSSGAKVASCLGQPLELGL